MLKCEMTLKEVYDSVILDNYNIALRSIKVVDTDKFKTGLVVNCIRSMNIILFNALKDEDISVSDFNYLVLQVNDLSNELLKYVDSEYVFL